MAAAACSALGFAAIYWWTDDTQWEGACLGVTFLLLAVAFVVWSHRLMPQGPVSGAAPVRPAGDERAPGHTDRSDREQAAILAGLDRARLGRRRVLVGSLGLVGASVAVGAVSTIRSLGPAPGFLADTAWRPGKRLVTSEGAPVHVDGIPEDGILTVFPQGVTDTEQQAAANAQAILIHLPLGLNRPLPGRASWAPEGFICYSKVCTHAGCPVNLYNRERYELVCPCHQSVFDVLRGAKPVFGPAGGPLPQLPLALHADGTLSCTGGLSGPPGPVYWHRS